MSNGYLSKWGKDLLNLFSIKTSKILYELSLYYINQIENISKDISDTLGYFLEKCRKHSPGAHVFYISFVFSNARLVLSHCNTRLRPLYLLVNHCFTWTLSQRPLQFQVQLLQQLTQVNKDLIQFRSISFPS